jgi:MoaE-MoaD fusion protein
VALSFLLAFNSGMKIKVLLFARPRELTGAGTIALEGDSLRTVADVWENLCVRHPQLQKLHGSILFSRNQEFASLDTVIQDGDEIGLFPPVSGGNEPSGHCYAEDSEGNVFEIVRVSIGVGALIQQLSQPADGAVVHFSGIVRNHSQGRKTQFLEYEGYEPMALKEMQEIAASAKKNWDIDRIGIVHRLGRLSIGEVSVAIVVTATHRRDAFNACQFAIDTLKKTVPIWKKEFFEDGEIWVEGDVS